MANVLVNETSLSDIADAIRSKKGVSTTYKPSEMATAIGSISGGITPTGTKQINTNGTHDVTAYASAEVNVPNSYAAGDEGKVVSNGALVSQTSDTVTTNDTYDTTLINSLTVNVSGSSGYSFDWANAQVVAIGANSVSNTSGAQTYFSSYSYDVLVLLSTLTTANQLVSFTKGQVCRYRQGYIQATTVGTAYDCVLVEGTEYLLLKQA